MNERGSGGAGSTAEALAFGRLDAETRRLLLRVAEHLAAIPFGTVEIVTQDRRVIQIVTSEKIRLR
jgi:hypothetical protein